MKKLFFILLVGSCIATTGCKKENPASPPPAPLPALNTSPTVFASANIGVLLPGDSAFLIGSATDAENNIDSYRWSQLSGPSLAYIQTPDSIKTKVSKLIKGEYNFELTVVDMGKLSGKAKVIVLVMDTSIPESNIKIFRDLQAGCWGGECLLVIDDQSIPRNLPIKVFFKSEDSAIWMETAYFWSTDRFLRIQFGGGDLEESKEWEVMIVF